MNTFGSLALAVGLAAPAVAQAPAPRFALDCGSLVGHGELTARIGLVEYVVQIDCPARRTVAADRLV